MNQKGFIAIAALIILALLVLGGGYYLVMKMQGTPTPFPVQQESAAQTNATTNNNVPTQTPQQSVSTSTNVPAANEIEFSATPISGAAPLTVSFSSAFTSDTQTNSIDFGDGQIGSLVELKTCNGVDDCNLLYSGHEYSVPGIYTATLSNCAVNQPHCSYGVVLGTVTITVASTSSSISVPGMSKYTDSNFGFSFWYPSEWNINSEQINNANYYPGSSIVKKLSLLRQSDPGSIYGYDDVLFIEEVHSTSTSLDLPAANGGGDIGWEERVLSFDTSDHTWINVYPTGTFSESGNQELPPGSTTTAAFSNSMGGLHVFGGFQYDDDIVPLSAHDYLVVGILYNEKPHNYNDWLASTIVATDPSVATPETTAQQTAAIQAEAAAYAGQ